MLSDAVALVPSPPPATAGALVSTAAALLATLTVILIGGYDAPGASTSERLHVVPVQLHPVPDAATGPAPSPGLLVNAESPAGSASVTVTAVPSVGSAPWLATVSVKIPA